MTGNRANSTRASTDMRATRASEERKANTMVHYNMEYVSKYDPPPGVMKEDHDYYWTAYEVNGQPTNKVQTMLYNGWNMVPSDRTNKYFHDPMRINPMVQQYIVVSESILMERPKVLGERDRILMEQKKQAVYESVRPNINNDDVIINNSRRRVDTF